MRQAVRLKLDNGQALWHIFYKEQDNFSGENPWPVEQFERLQCEKHQMLENFG